MPELAIDASHLVHDICRRIDAATDRAPWSRLSRDERIDHLPPLIAALLDTIAGDGDPMSDDLLDDAYLHGQHRREQGFAEDDLLDEYYILRDQVYRALRAGRDFESTLGVAYRLDPAITEATVESLVGYHGAVRRLRPVR